MTLTFSQRSCCMSLTLSLLSTMDLLHIFLCLQLSLAVSRRLLQSHWVAACLSLSSMVAYCLAVSSSPMELLHVSSLMHAFSHWLSWSSGVAACLSLTRTLASFSHHYSQCHWDAECLPLSLTVSPCAIELLHVSHCLPFFCTVSSSSINLLAAIHCLLLLQAVSHGSVSHCHPLLLDVSHRLYQCNGVVICLSLSFTFSPRVAACLSHSPIVPGCLITRFPVVMELLHVSHCHPMLHAFSHCFFQCLRVAGFLSLSLQCHWISAFLSLSLSVSRICWMSLTDTYSCWLSLNSIALGETVRDMQQPWETARDMQQLWERHNVRQWETWARRNSDR